VKLFHSYFKIISFDMHVTTP